MFRSAFGEKVYLRSGGYTQARADFYAADPKQIRDISVVSQRSSHYVTSTLGHVLTT